LCKEKKEKRAFGQKEAEALFSPLECSVREKLLPVPLCVVCKKEDVNIFIGYILNKTKTLYVVVAF